MKGKTRCPYCGEYVIVEVPDGATGVQTATCPNCGMKIKVDVSGERKETGEMQVIHPTVQKIKPTSRLAVAGALLLVVFVLGAAMGGLLLSGESALYHGTGEYRGKVVDEDGVAIQNARVYLDGNFTGVTDEEGIFILKNVSAGKHLLEIEKEGYKKIEAKIFVFPTRIAITSKFVLKNGSGIEKESDLQSTFIELIPVIATAIIIISFLPLIGAIFCFLKKGFVIALIASIFGIFSIGFFIGSVLSIIALIIILLSKNEFMGEVKY